MKQTVQMTKIKILLLCIPLFYGCSTSHSFYKKVKAHQTDLLDISGIIYEQSIKTHYNQWQTYHIDPSNDYQFVRHDEFQSGNVCDSSNHILRLDDSYNQLLIEYFGFVDIESVIDQNFLYKIKNVDSAIILINSGKLNIPKISKQHIVVIDMQLSPRNPMNNIDSNYFFLKSFDGMKQISDRIYYVTDKYELFLGS